MPTKIIDDIFKVALNNSLFTMYDGAMAVEVEGLHDENGSS